MKLAKLTTALCAMWVACTPAVGKDKAKPNAMPTYGMTQALHGAVEFCKRLKWACAQDEFQKAGKESVMPWSPQRMDELLAVNEEVNASIQPATDMEVYKTNEYWTIPTDKGDCEDVALLKRKLLMNMGWPAGALLMTVVLDEKGEGHAVLTARTSDGDYVLDNKTNDRDIWYKRPYTFVMRQSPQNPLLWESLNTKLAKPYEVVTGWSPAVREDFDVK
ncbi:MAG: transglutaminase-like cysteine peptidase [Alphaproteobacteria bacterium]